MYIGTIETRVDGAIRNFAFQESVTSSRLDVFSTAQYNPNDISTINMSIYQDRSGTYVYPKDAAEEMKRLFNLISLSKYDIGHPIIENEFVDGVFITKATCDAGNIKKQTILHNGQIYQTIYKSDEYEVQYRASSTSIAILSKPLHIGDYKKIQGALYSDEDISSRDVVSMYYPLSTLRATYDIGHLDTYDYCVVSSMDEAIERLDEIFNSDTPYIAVDCETTGVKMFALGSDKLVGVVLSQSTTSSTYFPFRQDNFDYNLPIEFLGEIAKRINETKKTRLGFYNQMEYHAFYKEGYDIELDYDVYHMGHLLVSDRTKGFHKLKTWAHKITNLVWLELDDIFVNPKDIKFNVLPPDLVKAYACPDTCNTIRVYEYMRERYPESGEFVLKLESRLQKVKARCTFFGLPFDYDKFTVQYDSYNNQIALLQQYLVKLAPHVKFTSASSLGNYIYNELGLPIKSRTKKGAPATDVTAVNNCVAEGYKIGQTNPECLTHFEDIILNNEVVIKSKDLSTNAFPVLVIYQKYKELNKALSMLESVFKRKSINDRFYYEVDSSGAKSNRQTSDAQQFPSSSKMLITADTPEHNLVVIDYSQVELRIMAMECKDENLKRMMRDENIDIHRAILSQITNKPIHLISDEERSAGKPVNFGSIYGITEYGLARDIFGIGYTQENLKQMRESLIKFKCGIPKYTNYLKHHTNLLIQNGYVQTAWGYRRYAEEITNKEINRCLNTLIQGYGATVMKLAEVNIYDYFHSKGYTERVVECNGVKYPLARIMLSVHDEVVLSVHKSIDLYEVFSHLKECMEIEIKDGVPLFAVPTVVKYWGEGKLDEYEVPIGMRNEIVEAYKNGTRPYDLYNIKEEIDRYIIRNLNEYIGELFRKYDDFEDIIFNFTHPQYTHQLIAVYIPKSERKDLNMSQRIRVALYRYAVKNGYGDGISNFTEFGDTRVNTTTATVSTEQSADKPLRNYMVIGNTIFITVNNQANLKPTVVVLKEISNEDSFYAVKVLCGRQTYDLSFKIDFNTTHLDAYHKVFSSLTPILPTT